MEKHVKVTRVFDASVEDVWKMWTAPQYVMQWWGPDKFTCPIAQISFKEGATSLVSMQAPNEFGGQLQYSIWTYTKIVPMQSIEFIQNLADKDGNKQKPTDVGMPDDFPLDVITLVTFKSLDNNTTKMTVAEYADFGKTSHFAQLGLEQCMDKACLIFKK